MRKVISSPVHWVLFATLVAGIWVNVATKKYKNSQVLHWDVSGYQIYLPALLIFDDIKKLDFFDDIDKRYQPSRGTTKYGFKKDPDSGNMVLKYTMGVAIFQLPGFLIADQFAKAIKAHPRDGYSRPYQISAVYTTLLFTLLGLFLLSRFLASYFSAKVVAVTIFCLAFGTNLFHYYAFIPGMSHNFLFFLYAVVLRNTQLFYQKKNFNQVFYTAVAIGLATLTRPTEIFLVLIPIFWHFNGFGDIKTGAQFIASHWKKFAIAILLFSLPILLQMIYWKFVSGNWIYYSYNNEGFEWLNWHIWEGLFSYKKGWFLYTPMALLGFIGLYFCFRNAVLYRYAWVVVSFFIPYLYIVFCWETWWYGGSFGCRAMIQTLAILALPLAALISRAFARLSTAIPFGLLLAFLVSLNCFQSHQYNRNIIHWDRMNKAYYWAVFGKTKIGEAEKSLLK